MVDKHGLLSAPIGETLRKMTLPMTMGMITILLFNFIDTFFVSLLGTHALAAISFTFPVTFAINCITMGMGVGLSTHIGRSLGQNKPLDAARLSSHGLLLALLLVALASTLGLLSIQPLFQALGASDALLPLIEQYMTIWYLTVPLLVIPMAGGSAIRATGDTKTPAKLMMASGLANGVLDPLLIFGYGPFPLLGIQGAAIASAISWFGVTLGILAVLYQKKLLKAPQLGHLFNDWQQILTVGTPAALSNAMTPFASGIIMKMLSIEGTAAVAAYGAAQRVESLLLIVLMSLTSVLTPFMAQNFGANQVQRSFAGLFLSMRFSVVFQTLLFVMMVPLSMPIAHLFAQEDSVRQLVWLYLITVPIAYGFQGVLMMLISSLNAQHKSMNAFLWSLTRLFVFILPCAWFGGHLAGAWGIFAGIASGNVLAGVAAYLSALRHRKLALSNRSY